MLECGPRAPSRPRCREKVSPRARHAINRKVSASGSFGSSCWTTRGTVTTGMRAVLQHLGSIIWLLVDTVREMGDHLRRGKTPVRMSAFFAQTDRAGVGSVPLVALVAFFLGLT